MKFYFVDDDKNIRTILKILVTERNLGECCGSSGNGDDGSHLQGKRRHRKTAMLVSSLRLTT